ncbi:putative transcription initiation factor tfiid subunit 12 [Phaeomoniella chlamydospora]|uniref:Putative transcription initiation factor tfiid subunit 12 n=1 Tax=Phaeomoniella chlamydospora TaxID=158046 RepID=A0A0G2DZ31_PHACM|nr:putative transcription initiation factor tfiid subunit 12 [Phaeomoniella chlamydospora]
MDGSGAQQPQQPQQLQPAQQSALIRAEQVKKLPHLNEQQKAQYEQMVQKLWEAVNGQPQGSENWNKAYTRLSHVSKQLMNGMRTWQAARQQANAAAQVAGAATPNQQQQPQQSAAITEFSQLNPQIQARVNAYPIVFPPTVNQGTQQATDWLREAKMRFGQALQRMELGKAKMQELSKLAQQREAAGNPFQQNEMTQVQTKMAQYRKTVAEANSFLERFKAQQSQFRSEAPPAQQNVAAASTGPQIEGAVEAPAGQSSQPNGQGPAPHTISSAVNAARNQATAAHQATMSPATQTTPTTQQPGLPTGTAAPTNQNIVAQSPYNATPAQADISGSAQVAIQQQQQQQMQASTRPQSLSQSAAVQQSAQSYQNNQPQPQSATTVHGHPPYMQTTSFAKKEDRMKISPHINTKAPEPVPMAPSRPTLTGGPSIGAIGQMGQPAIPKMPGYVLEGAGNERVLSKNKLNELVREITGAGPEDGDQLSPEAEEIVLNLADQFVDDLITSACRLAKLRGQSQLDIRDVQVILERQYNIRIPGYSTDEIRTVKKIHPNVEYLQKMGAVQAAKVTGSGTMGNNSTKE